MAVSGHGATWSGGGLTANIISISPGATTREVIDISHLASSATARKPGDLWKNEPWTMEIEWEGEASVVIGATATTGTITVNTSTGGTSALAGNGYFSSFTPGEITTDQRKTASCVWEWSSSAS